MPPVARGGENGEVKTENVCIITVTEDDVQRIAGAGTYLTVMLPPDTTEIRIFAVKRNEAGKVPLAG